MNEIEEIYKLYPRHVGKRAAMRAIEKALLRLQGGENGTCLNYDFAARWLANTTQFYAASPAGNKGVFTPYPSTWFNQSRYLDDPKEWRDIQQDIKLYEGLKEGWTGE